MGQCVTRLMEKDTQEETEEERTDRETPATGPCYLQTLPRGEWLDARRVSAKRARELGLDRSYNCMLLRVQRIRERWNPRAGENSLRIDPPNGIDHLDIPPGSSVRVFSGTESITVRVIDFTAFRRYEKQRRVDTGYLMCRVFAVPRVPLLE